MNLHIKLLESIQQLPVFHVNARGALDALLHRTQINTLALKFIHQILIASLLLFFYFLSFRVRNLFHLRLVLTLTRDLLFYVFHTLEWEVVLSLVLQFLNVKLTVVQRSVHR
jgi:hypothetical protein